MGLNRKTVRRYCQDGYKPDCTSKGTTKGDPLTVWHGRIEKLINDNPRMAATKVFRKIREEGYTGSCSTVQKRVRKQRGGSQASKPAGRSVDRCDLSRLIYQKPDDTFCLPEGDLTAVVQVYPDVQASLDSVHSFREVLKSGCTDRLDEWVAENQHHARPRLRSVANGISRDIEAVRLPYSNGIAEGNNTKIKLVMRVGYGRCSFDTLKSRIVLEDARRHGSRIRFAS